MSKVYLHSKSNEKSLIKILLILAFIYFLYGFYKNGIFLYTKSYVSLLMAFKPLFLLILSIGISVLFSHLKREENISFRLLSNVLTTLCIMPKVSIILYLIILVITNFLYRFYKFNLCALSISLCSLVMLILKNYTYLNIYEEQVSHNYVFFDYLIGKGLGGVGNTLLILSFISLIYLLFRFDYKKNIMLYSLITYYIFLLIYSLITKDFNINLYLNNNLIFAFIFVAPISLYSPYTKGAMILWAVALGLCTFLGIFLNENFIMYITITILSILSPYFDKLITKKYSKNLVEKL